MNENENKKDILEEVEDAMRKELNFLSRVKGKATSSELQAIDRLVKVSGIILATENLKERRYMNRTERKSEIRKAKDLKE